MQITETKVKVSDLCKNYSDNGDGGAGIPEGQFPVTYEYRRVSS